MATFDAVMANNIDDLLASLLAGNSNLIFPQGSPPAQEEQRRLLQGVEGPGRAQELARRLGRQPTMAEVVGHGPQVAISDLPAHEQTSLGVFESSFRLAGQADPRQARWNAMTGAPSPPHEIMAIPGLDRRSEPISPGASLFF